MSTFTASELLELDPETLHGLLELAPGTTITGRAAYLGLDCEIPAHAAAVQAAVYGPETAGLPFCPPIGAAQDGVRSDRTPDETEPETAPTGHPGPSGDALELPEPDPAAALDMAEMLAQSLSTGQPFMAGTFALYAHPSGAVVMVTESPSSGLRKDVIPKKIVKLALGLVSGKGTGMLGKMLGRG